MCTLCVVYICVGSAAAWRICVPFAVSKAYRMGLPMSLYVFHALVARAMHVMDWIFVVFALCVGCFVMRAHLYVYMPLYLRYYVCV